MSEASPSDKLVCRLGLILVRLVSGFFFKCNIQTVDGKVALGWPDIHWLSKGRSRKGIE